jgi:hypothetical protein
MPLAKLIHPEFDSKGKVVCQICGKSFLVISPLHLKKHNIIFSDYVKRYPNAPVSSEEFNKRSKIGRDKDTLFMEQQEKEIVQSEVNPEIEELDIEKIMLKEIAENPMKSSKNRILDILRVLYTNVRSDYIIRQFGTDGNLKFEFVTDFCDPILKIVIQFPDTFWHNQEMYIDLNKKIKLESYGWLYFEIPTDNPSKELIDKYLLTS